MELALSPPVFQSAKYLKIIWPSRKKNPNKGNFSAAQRALTGQKEEELQV